MDLSKKTFLSVLPQFSSVQFSSALLSSLAADEKRLLLTGGIERNERGGGKKEEGVKERTEERDR